MNTITVTTVSFVLWGFLLLVVGNLLKKHLLQHQPDWARIYYLSAFAVFAVITIIMIAYATSPSIDLFTRGTTEQFGQFGDLLGGILNPIFGFITILLLLQESRLQREDLNRNKTIRDIESVDRLITKAKQSFSDRLNNDLLLDGEGKNFSFQSVFGTDKLVDVGRRRLVTDTLNDLLQVNSFVELENLAGATFNHWHIYNLRHDFRSVIKLLQKRLELEDFDYSKSDIAREIIHFIQQPINFEFATDTEGAIMIELGDKYSTGVPL